ncbi:hypothetical protein C8R43DRAFT_1142040 [Mycena crocata]|nr:hypothetical protein C8R43DRAFT_1142040 [Mycena crocata]
MQFFKSVSFVGAILAIAASANPVPFGNFVRANPIPLANSARANPVLHPYGAGCSQMGQEYCCCTWDDVTGAGPYCYCH